jgi:hypothetical protein
MTDPKDPYPIEPQADQPSGGPPPSPPPASPAGEPAIPVAQERKAKLEAEPLLADFSEDADFDRDPELERAILGGAAGRAADKLGTEPGPERPEFVKEGFGEPQYWAIAGGVLLLAAMIATGVNAPNRALFRIVLTLYNALVHTGTGMVALYLAARLTEHRFGRVELAAARMFTAVSALMLVMTLQLHLTGYTWIDMTVRLIIAVGAYAGIVAVLFKLWDRTTLVYVIGLHALLWLIVEVGMALAAIVSAAPTTAVPGAGA